MRVGIDTGGTFTDFVWVDADGALRVHKESSTPADPAQAVLTGLNQPFLAAASAVVHGSTVATNALLERAGARTALITSAGFADVLAIGRQNRPDLYALVPARPAPLVPRAWRFELPERLSAAGAVVQALDLAHLPAIAAVLQDDEIESVAICFLFSYLDPTHEIAVEQALRDLPGGAGLFIARSSDILPEYREYERTATTVINAYVGPKMAGYLRRLAAGVAPRPLSVMQSNGGVIAAGLAGAQAARTCLSGPAGGVVGAFHLAAGAGFDHIITFDMGGTSTDVALCPGRLPTTTDGVIADLPLRLPIIDIHTVGAGGGSIAGIDPGGALFVGPRSAGAQPGPAAYGRGGRLATTTDANLVAGRLDAAHFLGGAMRLDEAAARAALAGLAAAAGLDDDATAAWQVLQVANTVMERAIRRVSVERGFDPRDFTLVPFGGAGPLHACELAAQLGIPRVFIPPVPGVLSALGMLVAPPARDYSRALLRPLDEAAGAVLAAVWASLRAAAVTAMTAAGHAAAELRFELSLDMRYAGQSHELTVPCTAAATPAELAAAWHAAHRRRYAFDQPDAAVELVAARLRVWAPVTPPRLPRVAAPASAPPAPLGEKTVWFDGRPRPADLYRRADLQPGQRLDGPAVIFQYDTTVVVPPDWRVVVDGGRNLILTPGHSETDL